MYENQNLEKLFMCIERKWLFKWNSENRECNIYKIKKGAAANGTIVDHCGIIKRKIWRWWYRRRKRKYQKNVSDERDLTWVPREEVVRQREKASAMCAPVLSFRLFFHSSCHSLSLPFFLSLSLSTVLSSSCLTLFTCIYISLRWRSYVRCHGTGRLENDSGSPSRPRKVCRGIVAPSVSDKPRKSVIVPK